MEIPDGKLYRESPLFTYDKVHVGGQTYSHGDCIVFNQNDRGRIVGISVNELEKTNVVHVVSLVSKPGAADTLYYDFTGDEVTLDTVTAQIKNKFTVNFSGSSPSSSGMTAFVRLNNWF
jgi:hypothetical protein